MAIISYVVKKTKNKRDDLIWSWIVKAFQIAEKVPMMDDVPSWLAKSAKAIEVLNAEYFDKYGTKPPADLMEFAKQQWTFLSQSLKKNS